MRKQDIKLLHKENADSLRVKLVDLRKSLFVAYNRKIFGNEKNVHVVSSIKKDIARILSVLRNKELGV